MNATHGSGGLIVDDGGNLTSATLENDGYVHISAGGYIAADTKIISGYTIVYDDGKVFSSSIQSDIITVSGGSISGLHLNTRGFINLYDGVLPQILLAPETTLQTGIVV
ncbi:hypothetical protein [Acetobacter sp. DmW_136]|uniref:hypothetical protein n=1 Tax=Acetobacter sp. DmW_136 TaxID=2591091 RepID=UPI001EE251CE|nr:hypothetical protein [Acetobacter sp. DmW_136]